MLDDDITDYYGRSLYTESFIIKGHKLVGYSFLVFSTIVT